MKKLHLNEGWFDYIDELNSKKKNKKKKSSGSYVQIFPTYNVNLMNRHLGYIDFGLGKKETSDIVGDKDTETAELANKVNADLTGMESHPSTPTTSFITGSAATGDAATGEGGCGESAGDGGAAGGMGEAYHYYLNEDEDDEEAPKYCSKCGAKLSSNGTCQRCIALDKQNFLNKNADVDRQDKAIIVETVDTVGFDYVGVSDFDEIVTNAPSMEQAVGNIYKWQMRHQDQAVKLFQYDPMTDESIQIDVFKPIIE